MRFLLVDDHPVVRQGIAQLLLREFPNAIIDEADCATQALQLAANAPELIVLDLSLPDTSGLEGLERLKRKFPELPILIVSMYEEKQYAERSIKSGAAGYLHKQRAGEEIVTVVRQILDTGGYVPKAVSSQQAGMSLRAKVASPHERLTKHEFQVLCMIADGKSVSEIAATLSRSVKTISTQRASILVKMELSSTVELMRYGFANGLVR